MRHLVLLIACLAASMTTAHAKNYDIQITPQAQAGGDDSSDSALWLAYGVGRSGALEERDKEQKKSANESGDDFVIELAGRQLMATTSADLSTNGKKQDPYFQTLRDIAAAGFLDEYVAARFARPGWTIPAENVKAFDFAGFRAWVKEHPLGEKDPTFVFTKPTNGKMYPDIPGQTLKDPATLSITHAACPDTRAQANEAWKIWEAEAKQLDGRALAANTRAEFLDGLELIAKKKVPDEGVTWVSPRPAALAYASGFCGVELRDYTGALDMLRAVNALRPTWRAPRMELVTVLNQLQKHGEAEQIIMETINSSTDRCDLGAAYRRLGYMRIDQGLLEEARGAYLRSLQYEPNHKIALEELHTIEQELKKRGGLKPDETYVPLGGPPRTEAMSCQ